MQENEKKPLVLKEILEGGLESLYDPLATTQFIATQKHEGKYDGQLAWLRKNLYQWHQLLSQSSGLLVKSISLPETSKGSRTMGITSWKSFFPESNFVLELMIKGGLNLELIEDSDMRESQSSQLKRLLALKTLKMFPPPFDIEHPKIAAGWPDAYVLEARDRGWNEFEREILDSPKLRNDLQEKSGDLLKIVRMEQEINRFFLIIVEWEVDAGEEEILRFRCALNSYFLESCKIGLKNTYPDHVSLEE